MTVVVRGGGIKKPPQQLLPGSYPPVSRSTAPVLQLECRRCSAERERVRHSHEYSSPRQLGWERFQPFPARQLDINEALRSTLLYCDQHSGRKVLSTRYHHSRGHDTLTHHKLTRLVSAGVVRSHCECEARVSAARIDAASRLDTPTPPQSTPPTRSFPRTPRPNY